MNIIRMRGELGRRFINIEPSDNHKSFLFCFLERGKIEFPTGEEASPEGDQIWHQRPLNRTDKFQIHSGTLGFAMIFSELELAAALRYSKETVLITHWIRLESTRSLANHPELRSHLLFYLNALLKENSTQAPAGESLKAAWLFCIILSLWRLSSQISETSAIRADSQQRLARFRALLELHYRERWSVKIYADTLGVTPDYLHHLCTESLEKTPSQLIRERTLKAAMTLLIETDAAIGRIAEAIGFPSTAYFCTYFRQGTGFTPTDFRKDAKRGASISLSFSDWP